MTTRTDAAACSSAHLQHDRTIRVAFSLDSMAVGGTEMNMLKLARALDRTRFSLQVFYNRGGPLLSEFAALDIPLRQIGLRSLKSPAALGVARRLSAWLREGRVDVLHTHDVYSNILGALATTPRGRTRLVVSRRWGVGQYSKSLSWGNRFAYLRADVVLTNSESIAASLRKDEGVPAARVVVAHNFVEPEAFEEGDEAERLALLARLGVPPDALVIGSIANLRAVKNHELAIAVLASLPTLPQPVHLVVIGEGPARTRLEALAQQLAVAARVHLVGSFDEAWRYHRAFDVSLLCSTSEGFPNTLVEAMAARRPIIATSVGGVPDAVIDGVTGFLVPPSDELAFRERLLQLLADPVLRKGLGTAGYAVALQRFHRSSVMPVIEQLYGSLPDSRQTRTI